MIINIEEIGDEGLHIHTTRNPEWLTNIPEINDYSSNLSVLGSIEMDFIVNKILNEISVTGDIKCVINCMCSRCIEPVRISLNPEINLLLSPGDADKDNESNIDFETYNEEEDSIDLSDYLRERIAISIPVKVICDSDCKGLCSKCGTNLNYGSCNCESEWVDPRFAKLKNLKV